MIALEPASTDAPAFLRLVQRLLTRCVALAHPPEVRVVCVDEWFDSKWLGFSGKLHGAVGVARRELTVPPFHPNRVWAEQCWRRQADGAYTRDPGAGRLHLRLPSARNIRRTLATVAPGALCLWYSAQSASSNRGALMSYVPVVEGYWSWYVAVARGEPEWRVTRRRGIAPGELEALRAGEGRAAAV